MSKKEIQPVAETVLRLAEKRGYVLARDIRRALSDAGHSELRWKEVAEHLKNSLHFEKGRYSLIAGCILRRPDEENVPSRVQAILKRVLEQNAALSQAERRRQDRRPFVRRLKIVADNDVELTVITQDLSCSGVRFIANRSLLGRKVRIFLPVLEATQDCYVLTARVLWTSAVDVGLFENGGMFLDVVKGGQSSGSLVG